MNHGFRVWPSSLSFSCGTDFMCIERVAWVRDKNPPLFTSTHRQEKMTLNLLSNFWNSHPDQDSKNKVVKDLRRGDWKWVFSERSCCICNSHCALGTAWSCYLRTICLVKESSKIHLDSVDSCMSSSCWIYIWQKQGVVKWDLTVSWKSNRHVGFSGGFKSVIL